MNDVVLAVDGGNVKTDLALIDATGKLLSLVRGARSSPHHVGVGGCVGLLEGLLAQGEAAADIARSEVAVAEVMLAGADLPEELAELRRAIEPLGWARCITVDNDTFALLRSGTDRGWGIAVVCGGGINCVGVAPDGRHARFPSLGPISGDWGGGYDVGIAAVMAAARSADGRGQKTALEDAVPVYFGLGTPFDLARALHLEEIPRDRIGELARVVYAAAEEDPVAASVVERLADEVIAFAVTALRQLELEQDEVDVVLGGGLLRAAPAFAIDAIAQGIFEVAPRASVLLAESPPIVGAALLGLDALDVDGAAVARARAELGEAFIKIEGDGARMADGHATRAGPHTLLTIRGSHG
jgi:N-acetylglucosamine kinase-like BadF-type ATPase